MVVLCAESHPSLPLELRYQLSKLIDTLSESVTRVTFIAENFNKIFKVTNQLYEWHLTRNHFPDTRGGGGHHHRGGGRVALIATTPTAIPSFDWSHWDAFELMINDSLDIFDSICDLYLNQNDFLDAHHDWTAGRVILFATYPHLSCVFPGNTPNVKGCILKIQPESHEQSALTPDTTMAEPTRTQVHVENQPDPNHVARGPGSYQDYLDALFVFETRFTPLYELCKLEHKMVKEMYDWHLAQNHFTEKCHVSLSKL